MLRHRPPEPELHKALPRLAAQRPDVFNAYQQTQGAKVEKVMKAIPYVASFIGHEAGKALFVGLYSVGVTKPLTREEYWQVPAFIEMKEKYGIKGFTGDDGRTSVLWFDLVLTDFCSQWRGKLIVKWPPPELAWYRRAHEVKNSIPVLAILEESRLDNPLMPDWREIELDWEDLGGLPPRWKDKLQGWRGIYYIFDSFDGKGYVGSAYGVDNLLGRWKNYAASGHGGNRLLRERDPRHFWFTILERVSPDMNADDVIRLEATWKERLHTRAPYGLNDN